MCIILDANRFSEALSNPPHSDYQPVIDWLFSGAGRLVYGGRKYKRELDNHGTARRAFAQLKKAGRIRTVPDREVDAEETALSGRCASDDEHVVAIARLARVALVCTEDTLLMQDVKNKMLVDSPRGHVYRSAKHKPLLAKYGGCIRSCSRR